MSAAMSRRAVPAVVLVPLLVVALVVSTSACGTMANFDSGQPSTGLPAGPPPPPVAYGGVQWDLERAVKSEADVGTKVLIFPVWLLELSLSATLDTATLPIVFWMNARRAWDRATADSAPPTQSRTADPARPRDLVPAPNRPTLAEQVLNPNPPPDDDDD
jgi:hypothetical protein